MPKALVENLDMFLADFGVPCFFGATSFMALLDEPAQLLDLTRATVHSIEYEITYKTSAVTLSRAQAGTVDGVAYTVREAPRLLDDGAFSRCLLSKT